MNTQSNTPGQQPGNIIRVDVSTHAPSRVPSDFPQEVLQAMPEWRSMFVHRAQFLAILQAPLTQTDTPITIVPIFSEYPDGTGDWGSSSTILVCGDTAKAKLEDFMTRIRQVFGQDCNIAFRASK